MRGNLHLIIYLLIAGFMGSNINASGQYWGKSEFESVLSNVLADFKNTAVKEVSDGYIYGIGDEIIDMSTDQNLGSWLFTITDWDSDWSGINIDVFYAPTLVTNFGETLQITFSSHVIHAPFLQTVIDEVKPMGNDIAEKYKSVVNFSTIEGRVAMLATYNYQSKDDEDELTDFIYDLMMEFRTEVFPKIISKNVEMFEDYREELWDSNLKYLTKENIELLFPELRGYEKEESNVVEGTYGYLAKGLYDCTVYNYGDSLEFIMYYKKPNSLTSEESEAIHNEFVEYVYDEGPPDGAKTIYGGWYPGYEGEYFLVSAKFFFDESYTYGDFSDYYYNVKSNYMQYAYDELESIIDSNTEDWW